jgi:hypothetical protein
MLEGRRTVCKDLDLVEKRSVLIRVPLVDRADVLWYFIDVNVANPGHGISLVVVLRCQFSIALADVSYLSF